MIRKNWIAELYSRIVNVLTFSGLSIRKKIVLFSIGALFWFCVVSVVVFFTMFETSSKAKELLEIIGPQVKTLDIAIRKLRATNISIIRIAADRDTKRAAAHHREAEARLRDVNSHLEKLLSGGVIKDYSQSTGHLYSEFSVAALKDADMRNNVSNIRTNVQRLESLLDSTMELKSGGAAAEALEPRSAEYDALINSTLAMINDSIIRLNTDWKKVVASIGNRFDFSMFAILSNFIITVVLSIVFGTLLSRSMRRPLYQITQQVRALSVGEVNLTQKLDVASEDELRTLADEFNKLLDSIYSITSFKTVIEGDERVEDIYVRMGKIFEEDLALHKCFIYQFSEAGQAMQIVYPADEQLALNSQGAALLYCDMDYQVQTGECRAKRTGQFVSSIACPGICKHFLAEQSKSHICIPIITSGSTAAVVQFIFEKEEECDIETKISRVNQYIREAQPVLEIKSLLAALKELSLKDPMTGINNRRYLDEVFEKLSAGIIRRGSILGLLLCDLDFFKFINDTYGHDIGDEVLKETASNIKGSVRNSDIVVRFGGEEFLVLLVDVKAEESVFIAEKIRERIQDMRCAIPGGQIQRTISIGISEFPVDAGNFWDAVKCADLALYKAKEWGRNRVVRFAPDMSMKPQEN